MTAKRIQARVLIITQYSLPSYKKHMNAYQRILYGSQFAEITVLIRKGEEVSSEIRELVRVHQAPVRNRWLYLAYAIAYSGWLRVRGLDAFLTEPTGMATAGFFSRMLFGTFWVLDLWDRPQWRLGRHEQNEVRPRSDRLIFWIMRHADLFLLSCMPEAVIDINPPEDRCAHFLNGIDPSIVATAIPKRNYADPTLHVAFGKSNFSDGLGLEVLAKAAELLKHQKHLFHFHIIGDMSEVDHKIHMNLSEDSFFTLHGVVPGPLVNFYSNMHAGIVPYLDYEDLRYIYPIKIMEHLSQGNPVVASKLPGISAMIEDGFNGYLVPPNDPEALAQALVKLQLNWERLATNALESVVRFDARKKNQDMFRIIKSRSSEAR